MVLYMSGIMKYGYVIIFRLKILYFLLVLYDEGNDPMLVPLPVLLLSYEDNGEPVNSGKAMKACVCVCMQYGHA